MNKLMRTLSIVTCVAALGVSSLAGAQAFAPMGTPFLRQDRGSGRFYNSQTGRQTNVWNGAPEGPVRVAPPPPVVRTTLVKPAPAAHNFVQPPLHVGVNIVEK